MSGQLIGVSKQNSTYLSFDNVCIIDFTLYTGVKVEKVGLLGAVEGFLSILNSNIIIQVSGNSKFTNFGSIGILQSKCIKSNFNNIQLLFNSSNKTVYDVSEINVAALIGQTNSQEIMLDNIQFIQCDIIASSNIACVSGYSLSTKIYCEKITITDSKLQTESETSNSAGLIGMSLDSQYIVNYILINKSIISSQAVLNCYSAVILSQSSGDQGTIDNCKIINIILYSKSQQITYTAVIIAETINSFFNILNNQVENISVHVQSSSNLGISAGIIAFSNFSNIKIEKLVLLQCNITSNSRFPISSAMIGTFINGINKIISIQLINNIILTLDQLYQNESNNYWGLSGMNYNNSTIFINEINILNQIIKVECQLLVSASALISQNINCTININSIVISNSTVDASSFNTINEFSVAASGIIGVDNFQNINGSSVININNIKLDNISISANSQLKEAYAAGIHAWGYKSQNMLSNIAILNSNISCSGMKFLRIGGIYAVLIYSFSRLNDIEITNCQFNANSLYVPININYDAYCGGIMGTLWNYANMELLSARIYNVNFTITGMITQVYTANVIGLSQGNITLSDIQLRNNIINSSGHNIVASNIVGQFNSKSYDRINSFTLLNSNFQSLTISTQNSTTNAIQFVAFVSSIQVPNSIITIINSMSLGYSTSNGIRFNNCDQLKVLNINDQLPQNGC
ncbi:Hypothetical_protein [Hexamita inflata]|uniref:Hypothetical_protein n=1 Tax=Hexamita inflata TaxID=28002 RepID=A0AA86NKL5_9EUKA|nr:Hypothetical protein HINF_LOCUS8479 [Hexamita inflata]